MTTACMAASLAEPARGVRKTPAPVREAAGGRYGRCRRPSPSNAKVDALAAVADDLGRSLAQLALAWCARNPHVSSVITGASRVEQVHENLAALDVVDRLDEPVRARIDAALA